MQGMESMLSRGKTFLLRPSPPPPPSRPPPPPSPTRDKGGNERPPFFSGGNESRRTKRSRQDRNTATKMAAPQAPADGDEAPVVVDRLSALPEGALYGVTEFLDAQSLLRMRAVSRPLRTAASQNAAGWDRLCAALWRDKVHVARPARDLVDSDAMAAYRLSVVDARERGHVTPEELCYDPETGTGFVWSFRFKEAAGRDWTSADPWFNYQPCRKMVLLGDGTVKMYFARSTPKPTDGTLRHPQHALGGNDDANRHGAVDGVAARDLPELRDPIFQGRNFVGDDGLDLRDPPVPMRWRLVTQALDLPARPLGSYVRFSVAGREVPTYSCRRSPTNNWGFVMESCWGVYASFELPPRPRGSIGTRRRLRRALDGEGNEVHIEVDIEDDDDSDVDEGNGNHGIEGGNQRNTVRNSERLLIDDDQFTITSEIQWREAFIYNFRSRIRVLPEGEYAMHQFELAVAYDGD